MANGTAAGIREASGGRVFGALTGCLAAVCLALAVGAASTAHAAEPTLPDGDDPPLSILQLTPEQAADPDVAQLIARGADFRYDALSAPEQLNQRYAAPGRTPLDLSVVRIEDGPTRLLAWRTFFRGAQAYLGAALSAEPLIGYYNPFLDYWVMTRWRRGDAGPVLQSAELVPGVFLRSAEARRTGALPVEQSWIVGLQRAVENGAPLTLRDALQESTALTVANFLTRYPEADATRPELPEVDVAPIMVEGVFSNRLASLLDDIVDFATTGPLAATYELSAAALAEEDPGALSDLASPDRALSEIEDLAEIPSFFRSQLTPVAAFSLGPGWMVFSTPPEVARWPVVMLIDAPEDGAERSNLRGVALYDLYDRIHGGA